MNRWQLGRFWEMEMSMSRGKSECFLTTNACGFIHPPPSPHEQAIPDGRLQTCRSLPHPTE